MSEPPRVLRGRRPGVLWLPVSHGLHRLAEASEIAAWRLMLPASGLACARHLSLIDLVVLIDSALHLERCSTDEVEEVAALSRRGTPQLRRALALSDGRSESAYETLLRLLHVTCDVPVEPQYKLRDEEGTLVARGDLWVKGTNALHEYDGEHHLERPQQRKDLARARRIGNRTWIRRGYTSAEVLHQAVGILRDADLSLGRPHRPERVRAWHALLVESCFTPAGRRLFLERLARPARRERTVANQPCRGRERAISHQFV